MGGWHCGGAWFGGPRRILLLRPCCFVYLGQSGHLGFARLLEMGSPSSDATRGRLPGQNEQACRLMLLILAGGCFPSPPRGVPPKGRPSSSSEHTLVVLAHAP